MKTRILLLTGLLFTLASVSLAHAGTKIMATGPAYRGYPSIQQLQCNIVNANTTAKPVTIEVMNYSGTAVSLLGPVTLLSFTGLSLTDASFDGSWCRFTVSPSRETPRSIARRPRTVARRPTRRRTPRTDRQRSSHRRPAPVRASETPAAGDVD
jgi:hypothetical protein